MVVHRRLLQQTHHCLRVLHRHHPLVPKVPLHHHHHRHRDLSKQENNHHRATSKSHLTGSMHHRAHHRREAMVTLPMRMRGMGNMTNMAAMASMDSTINTDNTINTVSTISTGNMITHNITRLAQKTAHLLRSKANNHLPLPLPSKPMTNMTIMLSHRLLSSDDEPIT